MESELRSIDRSDLWKDTIRALQLRIRDRFRIVVDRHRNHRQRFSENYLSSTLQRWILRFRNLYAKSSPSPSVFYRKRVNKDVDAFDDSIIVQMLQALAVPVIGNACHVFMHGLNRIQIYGAEKLHQAILQRPEGKPLISVSNHVASVDDPLVIASLLPRSVLFDAQSLRWTLCATDRCFSNPVTSAFFRCVKVLPISRGDGVYQQGLDMAISKLNNGGWVHIFPEGSRSRDGGRTIGSAKRGVGRLVLDADNIPMVIPFVHTGMQEVMPIGSKFPKIGKRVTVLIGDPIPFDDLLLTVDDASDISRGTLYDAVSSRIDKRLHELKIQVDRLALERSLDETHDSSWNAEHAIGILQQVDWEAFGIGSYISAEESSSVLKQSIEIQPKPHPDQLEEPRPANRNVRMGFSYEGGMMSRIRGYMDPTELMGFAVKGLFMNNRTWREDHISIRGVGPLKAWRRFKEANMFQQWHYM
ncbi:tafazzin [Cinnamomum micranthum f. kanehirae]|uniref:Tafazzin n=1 Tax=Cinnamomum micranthum f. kanehirae TaxID=337451 RepID=A0A443NDH2_9MAGN|nr:tafazzin [Cinnamomum micranthum f. kanehirae]